MKENLSEQVKKGEVEFKVIDISMPKGTNNATVTITPNFNSNRLTLNGVILPAFKSSVFKGRSI